ncbi:MAG: serine protease [Proteobacteria bacterium]|nr:serine protease [Pseudomonadota bacterium]
MKSPIRNSLAAIALMAVLGVVARGESDARAAGNATSHDVIQAVVGISAMIPEDARTAEHLGTMRSGSGIVIDDRGLVLTIGYLMLEASAAAVTDADGVLVRASLVAYDHNTGFGLLRARHPLGIKPVRLGSSADLAEGAPVIVISKGGPMPVMAARVASRREFAGYWEYLLEDAIFTVPPNPQYGGAALIDANGRLVGIGSLVVNDAVPGPEPVPGNMFVPIDALKPILSELLEKGRTSGPRHPWLGVYTNENRGRVVVTRTAAGGPADTAGIKPGDVVMGVGGKRVKSIADFYRKIWALGGAGVEVPLDLVPANARAPKIRTVKVRSQDRYDWLKLNKGF